MTFPDDRSGEFWIEVARQIRFTITQTTVNKKGEVNHRTDHPKLSVINEDFLVMSDQFDRI